MKKLLTFSAILAASSLILAQEQRDKNQAITIGLESSINRVYIKQTYTPGLVTQAAGKFTRNDFGSDNILPDLGIKLGYQNFLTNSFGFEGELYAGGSLSAKSYQRILEYELQNEYIALKTGVDLNAVFKISDKLELLGGGSYRFVHFISKYQNDSGNNVIQYIDGNMDSKSKQGYAFDSISLNSLIPQIGVRYSKGKHDFSLTYRFGGIIYDLSPRKEKLLDQSRKNIITQPSLLGFSETQILTSNFITLSYRFRFDF